MEDSAGCMVVHKIADIDRYLGQVRDVAAKIQAWIAAQNDDPLELLRRIKFETAGFHPIRGHPLNVIEQINQTWTFAVALVAARHLLEMHPEADGYRLAPGAHAAIELDIMSEAPGLVGAETFAAVSPKNNKKLETDLVTLAARNERHRYLFFMSPRFPASRGFPQFERDGVPV